MSSSVAESLPQVSTKLNPAELKIDLLCLGVRLDPSCRLEEGRPVCSRPADFASGLELILPGNMMELWVNAPINENFVRTSPYRLVRTAGEYQVVDERRRLAYPVQLAPNPGWYETATSSRIPMHKVGMLEGSCLVICLGLPCRFWTDPRELTCRFCRPEESTSFPKIGVDDVVETALEAQKKSGTTFVYLRGGYNGEGSLTESFPYIKALKAHGGCLVGLQFAAEQDLALYDHAQALGVDHFSFRLEFFNPDYHERCAPGKSAMLVRKHLFKAIEYCVQQSGKGRVSGEIIAGVEPLEDTIRAIDYLVNIGAVPLVRIFRPLAGTMMEDYPSPGPVEMTRIFRYVYEACRAHNLPIGILPNLHVSSLPHPQDTLYLASDMRDSRAYQRWIVTMNDMMRPYFLRRMRRCPTASQ